MAQRQLLCDRSSRRGVRAIGFIALPSATGYLQESSETALHTLVREDPKLGRQRQAP